MRHIKEDKEVNKYFEPFVLVGFDNYEDIIMVSSDNKYMLENSGSSYYRYSVIDYNNNRVVEEFKDRDSLVKWIKDNS